MLPLLITTSRTYTLGASAAAQPCLTVELAEFPQNLIIKLAMSLGQGKAYTRPYFRRATRACADAVRPAALHCSILCIRELCFPLNLKRYDWSFLAGDRVHPYTISSNVARLAGVAAPRLHNRAWRGERTDVCNNNYTIYKTFSCTMVRVLSFGR